MEIPLEPHYRQNIQMVRKIIDQKLTQTLNAKNGHMASDCLVKGSRKEGQGPKGQKWSTLFTLPH